MELSAIENFYGAHEGLCNVIVLVLVFGGMSRMAFWRDSDGLRVGGPLAVGLAMLLTVAAIRWARVEGRSIDELGPVAVLILLEAILIMGWAAFKKGSQS